MTNTLLLRLRIRPRPGFARALVAAPLALLAGYLVARGWLYPLWPDNVAGLAHPFTADHALDGSWGGPTLVGAWFVHAMASLGMQVLCLAGIRAVYRPAA